jgi:predicted transcriptional regulator
MKTDINRVTDLELKILQIIWQNKHASVADIIENWPETKKPGYTTILKTLQKMEKKEIVGHRREGKKYLYYSHLTMNQVSKHRLDTIIQRIFIGNKISFANFFLDNSELDQGELEEIRRLLEEKIKDR